MVVASRCQGRDLLAQRVQLCDERDGLLDLGRTLALTNQRDVGILEGFAGGCQLLSQRLDASRSFS